MNIQIVFNLNSEPQQGGCLGDVPNFFFFLQEKLREERNKEYNLFLNEQAQIRKLKRGTSLITAKVMT